MSQFLKQKGLSIERQRLKKKKIGTGVNFINILCASFLYESASRSFSLLHFGFVIFWHQATSLKLVKKYVDGNVANGHIHSPQLWRTEEYCWTSLL